MNISLHKRRECGAAIATLTYDSYGSLTSPEDADSGRFRYTGLEFEAEVGLYRTWARMYNPAIGRWMTLDPIRFSAGDANLSRYVENSPSNYVDPLGLENKEVPLPAGRGSLFIEWLPERGTGEVLVKNRSEECPPPKAKVPSGSKPGGSGRATPWEEFWEKVPLEWADESEAELEKIYKKYWMKVGEGAKRVKEIQKITEGARNVAAFQAGKFARMAQLFKNLGKAIGVLALIGGVANFCGVIAGMNPDEMQAWLNLQRALDYASYELETRGRISTDQAKRVVHMSFEWLKTLGIYSEAELLRYREAMYFKIDNPNAPDPVHPEPIRR